MAIIHTHHVKQPMCISLLAQAYIFIQILGEDISIYSLRRYLLFHQGQVVTVHFPWRKSWNKSWELIFPNKDSTRPFRHLSLKEEKTGQSTSYSASFGKYRGLF